jgi:hypothetical protein
MLKNDKKENKMKIIKKWLKENNRYTQRLDWFLQQKETDSMIIIDNLIADDKLLWASWLICKMMNHGQQIQYAIFAAEQVLPLFEKKCPNDDRPRKAIEAAKMVLAADNEDNRGIANAASLAASAYTTEIKAAYRASEFTAEIRAAYIAYAFTAAAAASAAAAAAAVAANEDYAGRNASSADSAAAYAAVSNKDKFLKILNFGKDLIK